MVECGSGIASIWKPPLTGLGHESSVNSIAVSEDGQWLIAGQSDGTLMVGAIRVADLKAKACKSAARNLSGAEWQIYLGAEPYQTCPWSASNPGP